MRAVSLGSSRATTSQGCGESWNQRIRTKKLDVSRSGYHAWKKRIPSDTSVRRAVLKEKIQKIYEDSHQNHGAPKITAELRKSGERVSEKNCGKLYASNGNQNPVGKALHPNNHRF